MFQKIFFLNKFLTVYTQKKNCTIKTNKIKKTSLWCISKMKEINHSSFSYVNFSFYFNVIKTTYFEPSVVSDVVYSILKIT